ncbi:MAG TPA: diguanylate cyclase, partial [Gemmataceae bacterium]|nr:diguanylate cyclase [Gemmataceae bacterium]
MSSDFHILEPFQLDPLTELPGRAALQARLAEARDMAIRIGQPLSLLALDLDHFKELNVKHFIHGGDQV